MQLINGYAISVNTITIRHAINFYGLKSRNHFEEMMNRLTSDAREAEFDLVARLYSEERRKAENRLASLARGANKHEYLLRWAIIFAGRDISSLSHGQLSDLQYELNFLVYDVSRFPTEGTNTPVFDRVTDWPDSARQNQESPSLHSEIADQFRGRLPSEATVVKLHQLTTKHFRELLKNGKTEMTLPTHTKLTLFFLKGQNVVTADLSINSDPETLYEQRLLAAISHHPDYLRRCPGCEILFFADRKNQDFHTVACRSRHYMRLRRDIPPDRFGILGRRTSRSKGAVPSVIQQPVKAVKKSLISSSKKTGKSIKSLRRKESGHGKKAR
jgi:hypothetical protein